MDAWTLHWLEASGSLAEFRPELIREFEAAYGAIAELMPPPRLDVLIQRLPGETLPELGLVGRAYRSTMFSMTLDPDNPNFLASLRSGSLRRHVVHEVHHCLRMAGPGYGWTLGEAMISEGLAGQFVRRVLGSEPELWERALTPEALLGSPVELQLLEATYYDHSEWFFGTGARPRWLGYTLGYQMVGDWLAKQDEVDAATWVNVPAKDILANATREGLVTQP
ncbi:MULTISPECIES: DUF2268 domain-containing putative Zn-dependent protease [unclassified Pseudomonas]|uniref:DUF2268 domain-containing putative Zn-dependent protease n=1 Tax=unclassified Pseudomonas TaxID=196821 RepID=UPI0015A1ABA8|nr:MULTISPECIES: DUF2268 domain-containing putative Zn-dependent protease [unclassified Pseudomonas]NWC96647.1 hypothetical protein [Pseudomonas sp. IPO3779]NWD19350.1 hypothetical protein [Pseudomonas sp. IPO3778]